ncbi:MAG: Cytochrome-c peroxidase [Bacteroidota bacterium]|nr:Cytochrome-c peroxidase [Bacteroidota bacterium]
MKRILVVATVFTFVLLLNSFTEENPYFIITKKDVELKIPKGFEQPAYNFKTNPLSPEVFVLGRKLFYDPILSKDQTISCSSCHQRIAAFAHIDHPLSHGIAGLIGKRNVAALQNLIWKDSYMADGGVNNLEVQPINPITNAIEMNESLPSVIKKLQANKEYVAAFQSAFSDTVVNSERLLKALAQFTGLMISSNSRYDKYINHDEKFNESETNGLNLFRAHCENCHKEPLFTDNSYRNIGLKPDTALNDSGRAIITGLQSDYMKFKVPGLRNVEMTYPYMHDGRFKNLKQVLDHYANGNFFTSNYDHSIDRNKGLTETEKADIIAFLKTLTDKEFLYDRRFADPNFR